MTRTTVTSCVVGRGRLISRFTSAFSRLEELVNKTKMASKRKRNNQKMPATPAVRGTDHWKKPISEMATMKRRNQGLCCFCSVEVIAMSPGKNCVRRAIKESITAPESRHIKKERNKV